MPLFWERALSVLLALQVGRLLWLNAELSRFMTRTPASWLAEGLLLLGLVLALRSRVWLPLTLGYSAILGAALAGYLADESGGGGNLGPELGLGVLALLSLTALSLRRHNAKL